MEIRPATRHKLGAVIIGDGFNITDDGVLSVDEESIQQDDYIEFTRERLEELFEEVKGGGGEDGEGISGG